MTSQTSDRTRVFGIAGHSGMGKTTLLERLLPELRARGLTAVLLRDLPLRLGLFAGIAAGIATGFAAEHWQTRGEQQ